MLCFFFNRTTAQVQMLHWQRDAGMKLLHLDMLHWKFDFLDSSFKNV